MSLDQAIKHGKSGSFQNGNNHNQAGWIMSLEDRLRKLEKEGKK